MELIKSSDGIKFKNDIIIYP